MSSRSQGFTLLEIMMVILLIGVVSRLVVATLPVSQAGQPLDQLQHSARWAWEQAQLEARIWRMQIRSDSWELSTLTGGDEGEKGPLPDTVWHAVEGALSQGRLESGVLRLKEGHALPVTLWFLPDGDMTQAHVEFHPDSGDVQPLILSSATLSAGMPQ